MRALALPHLAGPPVTGPELAPGPARPVALPAIPEPPPAARRLPAAQLDLPARYAFCRAKAQWVLALAALRSWGHPDRWPLLQRPMMPPAPHKAAQRQGTGWRMVKQSRHCLREGRRAPAIGQWPVPAAQSAPAPPHPAHGFEQPAQGLAHPPQGLARHPAQQVRPRPDHSAPLGADLPYLARQCLHRRSSGRLPAPKRQMRPMQDPALAVKIAP